MQNEDVRIRQNESAMNGPSGQEVFFDEHTCDSVIYDRERESPRALVVG
jgi:hypothetical protein